MNMKKKIILLLVLSALALQGCTILRCHYILRNTCATYWTDGNYTPTFRIYVKDGRR